MFNPFFSNSGPFYISEILKLLKINLKIDKENKIEDIVDLLNARKDCITFFPTLTLSLKLESLISIADLSYSSSI